MVVDGDVYLGGDVDNDYEPENAPEVPRPNKVKFIEVTDAEEVIDDGNDGGLGQRTD